MTDEGKGKVTFCDENGTECEFEHLATIEYEKKEYVVLIPFDEMDDDEQEVIILRLEIDEAGDECYFSIDDYTIEKSIFDLFKLKFRDEFNFS